MLQQHLSKPDNSLADILCTLMVLCRGKQINGKPFWAYMCVRPSRAKMFYEARKTGNLDLDDYGTVLEWGEGSDPPQEIKERMKTQFGMRDDYEDMLMQLVEKQ